MLTHEYETVVILRPDLDDAETREHVEKLEQIIADNSGTMLLKDEWGKRKLAYAIDNHLKGHYVLYNFLGPASAIDEIERRIRINDRIIRFMTIKLEDNVDIPAKVANAAEVQAKRDEEARIRAEQEAERAAADAENNKAEDNASSNAGKE
jgi:small subunit ribosomal protein S6